ncbi:MAG: 3-isopropylmalate dehydratase small subunit [uncultured Frankineae bacterium]|uniref:3-isopropylmalate dehydratase small subunit n=1 Tax=uncultured Frankineae bacterium TaxID=437475 RepID=A0A6J4L6M2_9ACTN|nr:MAG: 3-isopropylmalate dehydratase small subunit [uncultured Frankineae bacterium]
MEAITTHTGRAVPLRRSDVDTDQIIPSDWLKRVTRTGFGAGLFSEWRADPGFVLEQPQYAGASVLVAGENFGTGSSREHAVWALLDYGFAAVVSPRFGDIFRNNALKGGLVPVQLTAAEVSRLWELVEADPTLEVTVDLGARELRAGELVASFPIDDFTRWRLMEGLDDIGLTLRNEPDISAYEAVRPSYLPSTTARG